MPLCNTFKGQSNLCSYIEVHRIVLRITHCFQSPFSTSYPHPLLYLTHPSLMPIHIPTHIPSFTLPQTHPPTFVPSLSPSLSSPVPPPSPSPTRTYHSLIRFSYPQPLSLTFPHFSLTFHLTPLSPKGVNGSAYWSTISVLNRGNDIHSASH